MTKKTTKKSAPRKRAPKAKPSIYERIFNVQRDLKTVLKSMEHAHNKYMYATERDFIAEIKPLVARERILILADTITHTATPNYEGVNQHTVAVRFTLVNVDNTEQTVPEVFYGVGDDKKGSVVGLPIAYTMALKYFLAKTFIAETGTDAEGQVDDEKKGKGTKTPSETPVQAVATIKTMVQGSRNIDGLVDYAQNKLPNIKKFTAAQKKEISDLISARVDELTNN